MSNWKSMAMAGCSLLLLTHCASQDDVQSLQYQVRTLNHKLEDVRHNDVNQMQSRQANSSNKLDQMESETMRMRSSMEENSSQSAQFREQMKQDIDNLQNTKQADAAKIAALNQRIAVLEEKLSSVNENFSKIQQDRVSAAEKRAKDASARAEEAQQRATAASMRTKNFTAPEKPEPPAPPATVVRVSPSGKKTRIAMESSKRETNVTPQATEAAAPPAVITNRHKDATPAEPTSRHKEATTPPPKVSQKTTPPAKTTVSSKTTAPQKTAAPKDEAAAPPAPAEKSSGGGGDSYAKGMNEYKSKNYKGAYKTLEQSLAKNPNGPEAGKTLYYMGESLYNQGEYDLAILDYQKVISNHGKDSVTPGALLKQGMSFEKLTDNDTAKIIYKKLIADHPGSAEAAKAKERLKSL